jgi:Ca2+-binding RTX toxin-like protein
MATQIKIAESGYGNPYLDSLISGYAWGGTPIRVAFAVGDIRPGGKDGTGTYWTAAEEQAFKRVMGEYEAVANIDYQITGDYDRADILWYSVGAGLIDDGAAAGHHYPSGKTSQVFGYFRYDVQSWEYLQPGSSGYQTILHELGHGLGLEHPHLDDADTASHTPFPGVMVESDLGDNNLNQGIWTAMSYNDGWERAEDYLDSGNAITPMAFDIAALQRMYGANMNYRTGDDYYFLGPYWDTPGNGWRCIWDAGGLDTISAVGTSENAHIDLRAATLQEGDPNAGGYVSYYFTGGMFGAPREIAASNGFTIANGVVIEHAIGGLGNDELIGNHAHNNLTGGAGADLLDGGFGYDTAIYDAAHYDGIQIIDMLDPWAGTFDARGDAFISIEAVRGSQTSDDIRGTDGVEALYGGAHSDTLQGRGGGDILDGGEGRDFAAYGNAVTVDMMFSYLNTGEAAGDTLIDIEGLSGSNGVDDLRGDGLDNNLLGNGGSDQLRGRAGNDSLEGGSGNDRLWGDQGSDLLDGGSGRDTMYGGTGDDVYIVENWQDQVIEYANEGYDTIGVLISYTLAENSHVERVEGDSGDISITGNSLGNELFGGFGDNGLFGMGGNDTLDGWVGSDWIEGGEGDDLIMVGNQNGHDTYIGGEGSDTLALRFEFDGGVTFDLAWGTVPLFLWGGYSFYLAGSLTWSEIENLRGGNGDDTLHGDDADNTLSGGPGGNDELHGRGGNDSLIGGIGFDALYGDEGDDTLVGNYEYSVYGVDYMEGGEGSDTANFTAHGNALWIDLSYTDREVWTRDRADVDSGAWRQVANLASIENVVASAADDKLWGNDEANRIDGAGGNDFIDGRDGNDTLTGGTGFDEVHGGAGDDTLFGTYEYSVYGVDYMDGGEGSDTADFSQHGKAVWIDLGYAGREVWTTDSTDLASGPAWREVADLVSIENLTGSAADDYLAGDASDNVLRGGGGNDLISGGGGTDIIEGGDGLDIASFGGLQSDYAISSLGDGTLSVTDLRAGGTDGADILSGIETFRFADGDFGFLLGTDASETINGTAAADWILGFFGNDKLIGGAGEDRLEGGDGNDRLDGQDGNDMLRGGEGADIFVGGAGIDTADYSDAATAVYADLSNVMAADGAAYGDRFTGVENLTGGVFDDVLRGSTVANRLSGGEGADWMDGGAGNDTLDGGNGYDVLYGGAGADSVSGGEDADWLEGGAGNDIVEGGGGADWIFGGAGNDRLTGGLDGDVFVFQGLAEQRDTITDFTVGEDLIGLSAAGFGIENLYDLDFIAGGAPKAGAAPCFLYNTTTGTLSFDPDGRGGVGSVAFATITGAPELGLQDFVLV